MKKQIVKDLRIGDNFRIIEDEKRVAYTVAHKTFETVHCTTSQRSVMIRIFWAKEFSVKVDKI